MTILLTAILIGVGMMYLAYYIGSVIYKRGEDKEILPGLYNFMKRIDLGNDECMITGLISGTVKAANKEWLTPTTARMIILLIYFVKPVIINWYYMAAFVVIGFKQAQAKEEADAVEGSVEEIIIKKDHETAQEREREDETMNGQEINQEFEEVVENDVNTEELVIPSIFSVGPEEIAEIRTQDNEYGFIEIEDTLEDDYKPLMNVDEDDKI